MVRPVNNRAHSKRRSIPAFPEGRPLHQAAQRRWRSTNRVHRRATKSTEKYMSLGQNEEIEEREEEGGKAGEEEEE